MSEGKFFNIDIIDLSIGFSQGGKNPYILRKGLNFSANNGEMVALIGGNGIGKSTLLRSIVGFSDYFNGDITINGSSIKNFTTTERAKLISFVSTEIVKVANMTVFDLVAFGRFPHTNRFGKLNSDDKTIIYDSIKHVGLTGFEQKPINQISDGERQRVMIARALAQDTPIIILDEPTAFLDISNKYEIFHLLQTVAREKGKTIVLSTHDLNIVLREVDKLWIMLSEQTFEGSPEDAVLTGKFDELFSNNHIGFDVQEGEYYFKKDFISKVKVIGEGMPLSWTLRAMNRMGFQIVTDIKPDFTVEVQSSGGNLLWKLTKANKTDSFTSLYELFRALQ